MAATLGSETTAAIVGQVGIVRRDPFAMLAFCGYNISDYFAHWIEMGRKVPYPPKLFMVNWFRKGADGKFVWPGYGENMRVLKWILERLDGQAGGVEHAFGISPRYEDLHWEGLAFTRAQFESVISVDPASWRRELTLHGELFEQLAPRLPEQLLATRQRIERKLAA